MSINSDGERTVLTDDAYKEAFGCGRAAAREHLNNLEGASRSEAHYDDVRESVHPRSFSEALDALEDFAALPISEAVDDGINEAWNEFIHDVANDYI
jgi:hypothetical protein